MIFVIIIQYLKPDHRHAAHCLEYLHPIQGTSFRYKSPDIAFPWVNFDHPTWAFLPFNLVREHVDHVTDFMFGNPEITTRLCKARRNPTQWSKIHYSSSTRGNLF
eukprot:UN01251